MLRATFSSLTQYNFRVYAIGTLVSNVGTWMQGTALAWLVFQLTGSASAVGAAVACQFVPMLLLAPIGGVIADGYDKRDVLRAMQVAMAVPAAVLGALAVSGHIQTWQVFTLALVFGAARALENPARNSFVSQMVADRYVVNAISLNSASVNSARMVGPGVAGVLISALGSGTAASGWVIAINAASYGSTFVALSILDVTQLRHHPPSPRATRRMRPALVYLRTRPDLVLALACVFFLGGFGLNFETTNTVMVIREFGLSAREFGIAGSVLAVGSLTGALLAAARMRPRLKLIVYAGISFSALQVMSGLAPSYESYVVVLPIIGMTATTVIASTNALIQLTCDPQFRGRVAAVFQMVFIGTVPVAAPLIGWISDQSSPRVAVVSSGLLAASGVVGSTGVFVGAGRRRQQDRPHLCVPNGVSAESSQTNQRSVLS